MEYDNETLEKMLAEAREQNQKLREALEEAKLDMVNCEMHNDLHTKAIQKIFSVFSAGGVLFGRV